MGIFKKRQYGVVTMPLDESNVPVVPDGTWVKCDKCGKIPVSYTHLTLPTKA